MRHQHLKVIENLVKKINESVTFEQGSIINNDNYVNFYAYIFDKDNVGFDIYSSFEKKPLTEIVLDEFVKRKVKYMVGINTNAFFMAEKGYVPKSWAFNLDIKNGMPLQLPTNKRPTIFTLNNRIYFDCLEAKGSIVIGNVKLDWQGSHYQNDNNAIVFGNFDIPQKRKTIKGLKNISAKYIDGWIYPKQDHIVVGISFKNKSTLVSAISSEKLNLFDHLYILSVHKNKAQDIQLNDRLHSVEVDNFIFTDSHSAQSLITELPINKGKILQTFQSYLINNNLSEEFIHKYKKAWSIILETKNKIVFLVIDARPLVKGQEGLTAYELHDFISHKFDFDKAFISDAGQSSRIVTKFEKKHFIYGNMHYLNYKHNPPIWSGKEGRFVPGALLAYNLD